LKRGLNKEAEDNSLGRGNTDAMKGLLWISIIIAAIVAIYELTWLGRSDLAWVILGLAIAVALQAVYLLVKKK